MENQKEIWKDVIGYEGLYQVSNFGNVMSMERYITESSGKIRIKYKKKMKLYQNEYGYMRVILIKNKIGKNYQVHRLVSLSFIENKLNKLYVNHKDGIKNNNNVENLEWVTKSENELHAYRVLGKINIKKGSRAPHLFVGIKQYDINMNFIREYKSITDASIETNTSRRKISSVAKGYRNKTNNFIWRYC